MMGNVMLDLQQQMDFSVRIDCFCSCHVKMRAAPKDKKKCFPGVKKVFNDLFQDVQQEQ